MVSKHHDPVLDEKTIVVKRAVNNVVQNVSSNVRNRGSIAIGHLAEKDILIKRNSIYTVFYIRIGYNYHFYVIIKGTIVIWIGDSFSVNGVDAPVDSRKNKVQRTIRIGRSGGNLLSFRQRCLYRWGNILSLSRSSLNLNTKCIWNGRRETFSKLFLYLLGPWRTSFLRYRRRGYWPNR